MFKSTSYFLISCVVVVLTACSSVPINKLTTEIQQKPKSLSIESRFIEAPLRPRYSKESSVQASAIFGLATIPIFIAADMMTNNEKNNNSNRSAAYNSKKADNINIEKLLLDSITKELNQLPWIQVNPDINNIDDENSIEHQTALLLKLNNDYSFSPDYSEFNIKTDIVLYNLEESEKFEHNEIIYENTIHYISKQLKDPVKTQEDIAQLLHELETEYESVLKKKPGLSVRRKIAKDKKFRIASAKAPYTLLQKKEIHKSKWLKNNAKLLTENIITGTKEIASLLNYDLSNKLPDNQYNQNKNYMTINKTKSRHQLRILRTHFSYSPGEVLSIDANEKVRFRRGY